MSVKMGVCEFVSCTLSFYLSLFLFLSLHPSFSSFTHHSNSPPSLPIPFAPSARLTNLSISNGGKLEPHFNELVFNYSAILAPHVNKFTITVYLPHQQIDKHYAASIDSIPLKSGVESPLLKLRKGGKDITFQIFVTAINHRPSTYLLYARREGDGWRENLKKTLTVIGIAAVVFVGGLACYLAYAWVCAGRRVLAPPANDCMYHPVESYS